MGGGTWEQRYNGWVGDHEARRGRGAKERTAAAKKQHTLLCVPIKLLPAPF